MQTASWTQHHLQHCKKKFLASFYDDPDRLNSFNHDFGKLIVSHAAAVFIPSSTELIQEFVTFAHANNLPLTVRGNGMSQCGQSLPLTNGVTLSTSELNTLKQYDNEKIWVDTNVTWSTLIKASLKYNKIPYVTPYNCNLSIGGVLSVGGVGAASFKYGVAINHVHALEVITADGNLICVDASSPLFHACLGGQGQFAIITKACIQLRSCKQQVRTFFLTYTNQQQLLHDIDLFSQHVDYIECFCSPAVQGAKITLDGRKPFAEWLFALQVSIEFNEQAPELSDLSHHIKPWKILHSQDESIESYLHRHEGRFQFMKLTGQWEQQHPWYECFAPKHIVFNDFQDFLASLPLFYASILQIVPIKVKEISSFMMLPKGEEIFSVMILNPGLPAGLIPNCLETIRKLDNYFLPQGGKRYLSGYLGKDLDSHYWQKHFGQRYNEWLKTKSQFDPNYLFQSALYDWQSILS